MKLGGSVVTQKHRDGVFIRRKLLARIADEIAQVLQADKNIRLIIIHGAGSGGHQLANQYRLGDGANNDSNKMYGSLLTRIACQKLDLAIAEIFLQNGLMVASVHTASTIIQKDKIITNRTYDIIDQTFKSSYIPMMYGEMVFDKTLGMSVCSGDAIAMEMAKKYKAEKIIFASDIDGIYDKDPHVNSDAKLVTSTSLQSIMANNKIALSGSHNVDVTGGLKNKIAVLVGDNLPKSLKKVVVCNGLKKDVIARAFTTGEKGTVISI